jgi:hypothetical protein
MRDFLQTPPACTRRGQPFDKACLPRGLRAVSGENRQVLSGF